MEQVGRFSLRQKVLFNLLFVLLIVAGFFAMFALPTERFPDINMAKIIITTDFPGASPVDVETLVTRKLEQAVEDIDDIDWIASTSQSERSYIRIKLKDDSDYADLYDEIRFRVLNAKADLPAEIDQPRFDDITVAELVPVVTVNIGGDHGNRALMLMAEQFKTALKKIEGVKKVVVSGEQTREFHITLSPQKLTLYGVSFDEVSVSLQNANISATAGNMKKDGLAYLIKVDEKFDDQQSVLKTIVRRDGDGSFVTLEDLAISTHLQYRSPTIISTVNGKNAIGLQIVKTPDGSSLAIKSRVLEVINEFRPLIESEQLEITLTQDSSMKINDGLSTLGWNFIIGMILVSLVSWYFMGGRNAALITIGVPFSFLTTMLVMYVAGYSFNELTLFAFVLVSGIIVDDAIVVMENIYRYIQQGYQAHEAIVTGLGEVAYPVLASTLTTIAAFLPLLIMSGTTGEFFAQIPAIVSFALFVSLFECFFILPVHYMDFGPQKAKSRSFLMEDDNFVVSFFRVLTKNVLQWTLKFRVLTISIIFVLLTVSVGIMYVSVSGIFPLVKTQFFPDDYSVYFIDIKGKPNTAIEQIDQYTREISDLIMAEGPGKAQSASGLAGVYMNEDYELVFGHSFGVVIVTLPEPDLQTIIDPMEHLQQIRNKLKPFAQNKGVELSVHAMKEGPPAGKPLNIKVLGSDLESVEKLGQAILRFLTENQEIAPYLLETETDQGQLTTILQFDINHNKVSEFGLSSKEVTQLAASVLDGRYVGKFRTGDEEIDLKLLLDTAGFNSYQSVLSTPVIDRPTGSVLLGDLVQVNELEEPGELNRFQGFRSVSIKSDLVSGATVSPAFIVKKVAEFYEPIRSQYPGASVLYTGEFESTQKSFKSLIFAFFISVMLIYIILATQFQSYLQPVIILFAVLFALIGIILGKFFVQSIFTINSFIAAIGVVGVVVNDALVLIDFMNRGYRAGMERKEAIQRAIDIRLRPIVLTTLTTILGLLPMALGIPSYSIVWGSMASTFVCGLGVATLLTLWVVPVLWDLIQSRHEQV